MRTLPTYRNLVFMGGGILGVAYGGAMQELEARGVLPHILRVGGTSAGAISAALASVGYGAAELTEAVTEMEFDKLLDKSPLLLGNVARVLRRYGWHKGDAFVRYLGAFIAAKVGTEQLTFGEHAARVEAGQPGWRHLYVVATNLTRQRAEVFSHERTPEVRVVDAVRASMSVPLLFAAPAGFTDVMADGGLAYNFPVSLFDNARYQATRGLGGVAEALLSYDGEHPYVFNEHTLGLRIDHPATVKAEKRNWDLGTKRIDHLGQYAQAVIYYMMNMANNEALVEEDLRRSVFISSLGIDMFNFNLPQPDKERLIASGRQGVAAFFEGPPPA